MIARVTAIVGSLLLLLPCAARADKAVKPRHIGSHEGGIASVHFSPDGKRLVTGGGDQKVRVWNVADGKQAHECTGPTSFTCAVRFSPDGKTIAAGGYETGAANLIYLINAETGGEVARLPGHPTGGIRRLAFTPDGKHLVSGGFDGYVRVWDLASHREVRGFKVEAGTVYGLSLSPDGKLLATAGRDGLRVWDMATGNELPREGMNKHSCVAVTFAPDGKLVASGDGESVKLWEVATGKEVQAIKGFKGELSQLVFSNDGKILYTASYDHMVRMWETRTGKLVHEIEAHTGWVWGLALSADEKTLATCSVDTKLLCWDLTDVKLAADRPARLSGKQVGALWEDLGSEDTGAAYRAVCLLAGDPETSLPILATLLTETRWSGPSAADVGRLIADLDSDSYKVREQASEGLQRLGARAVPALQKALKNPPSAEVKKRAQRLLAQVDPTEVSAEDLVAVRSVQTLEYMGTREAKQLLEQLARRGSERLSTEASEALARLRSRR